MGKTENKVSEKGLRSKISQICVFYTSEILVRRGLRQRNKGLKGSHFPLDSLSVNVTGPRNFAATNEALYEMGAKLIYESMSL